MQSSTQEPLALPQNSARFSSDWISARFWKDRTTGQLTIAADGQLWNLEPEQPELLDKVLDPATVNDAEFNAHLKILLVPRAHEIAGTSFFRLRHP
ncbi:hypothetical protein QMQ05_01135 [Glutamicibacter ectropisis]|uniref:Uncharacterized protein n=1 Tax=Glutamicibacter ectropisis TaxID=3046593 RepID=A0AAU6WDN9_9MICC